MTSGDTTTAATPDGDDATGPTDYRPRVYAHRGGGQHPEHSLEAYVEAIEHGADGLECDVRLTADEHLVCVHDPTVDRTSAATGRVSSLTLGQLRAIDWGCPSGGPLTLRDLFELVHDCGRRVEIAVETKHPTRYSAVVEQAVADLLDWFGWLPPAPGPVADPDRFGLPTPVRVMSFSAAALRRMARINPAVPLVHLLDKPGRGGLRTLPGGAGCVGPGIRHLAADPHWQQQIRAAGKEIAVWTVDTPQQLMVCRAIGADIVITNRPREILELLDRLVPTAHYDIASSAVEEA